MLRRFLIVTLPDNLESPEIGSAWTTAQNGTYAVAFNLDAVALRLAHVPDSQGLFGVQANGFIQRSLSVSPLHP